MTKSFRLTRNDSFYTAVTLKKVKQGNEVFHKQINTKAVCSKFIHWLSGTTPDTINITVSTDENPGATKIFVTKCGYYRWWWSNPKSTLCGGIPNFTEEILTKFFPNANEQGKDTPHPLWITFK